MKKILYIGLLTINIILLCGCGHKFAGDFKKDYESLNGLETTTKGVNYLSVNIDKNNPFVYSSVENINKKIEDKDTFIVLFGASWSPWCRSIISTIIETANEESIETIYYIDVRPNNDIKKDIRDIFDKDSEGKVYLSYSGSDAYHTFLKYANNVLPEYSYQGVSVSGTEYAGTKRIGVPTFILVKKGIVTAKTNGISSLQTDPYMNLTDEIKSDIKQKFKDFLKKLD